MADRSVRKKAICIMFRQLMMFLLRMQIRVRVKQHARKKNKKAGNAATCIVIVDHPSTQS